VIAEQPLGRALRDVQHERVARVDPIEPQLRESAAALEERHAVQRDPALDELLLERQVIEMLDRAGVEDDGLGLVGRSGRSVDDAAAGAMPSKLGGEHEADRPGPDHERVHWRFAKGHRLRGGANPHAGAGVIHVALRVPQACLVLRLGGRRGVPGAHEDLVLSGREVDRDPPVPPGPPAEIVA
jgi:hypothetical protein